MRSMLVLAAVAALSFSSVTLAADEGKKTEMTGVLIDNHCGEEMASKEGATAESIQKSAAEHKKGCCMKCAKDGGLSLMYEGKMMKLDEKSSEKAMDYLKGKKHGTKVTVEATKNDDGSLTLASIEPAKKKDKSETK